MRDHRVLYVLGATGLTAVVVLLSLLFAGPSRWIGVLVGGGFALGLQLLIFLLLGVLLFPGRRLLVFAMGMGMRIVGLGVLVLVTVRFGLPPAATLLTLVAVFLVTTVLEPMVFQLETKNVS